MTAHHLKGTLLGRAGSAAPTPGLSVSSTERNARLHDLVRNGPPLLLPGVPDAIWARLVEQLGFDAVYVSGAGVSNSYLGLADTGLLSFTEMLNRVERIVEAVRIPVVVDADTGYGGLTSVARTTALLERAGVSAMQIEDQTMPKRCGHFDGRALVPTEVMQARIDAAVSARRDDKFQVIARTDASSIEGFQHAIARASKYVEAGADILFVESPESIEEIKEIPNQIKGVPLLFNVVEGGKSPDIPRSELEDAGFRVILHGNYLLRSALLAGSRALEILRDGTGIPPEGLLLSWEDRQSLVRLPQLDAFENNLRKRWSADA